MSFPIKSNGQSKTIAEASELQNLPISVTGTSDFKIQAVGTSGDFGIRFSMTFTNGESMQAYLQKTFITVRYYNTSGEQISLKTVNLT